MSRLWSLKDLTPVLSSAAAGFGGDAECVQNTMLRYHTAGSLGAEPGLELEERSAEFPGRIWRGSRERGKCSDQEREWGCLGTVRFLLSCCGVGFALRDGGSQCHRLWRGHVSWSVKGNCV